MRLLVTGIYTDPSTYKLINLNGTVYKVIREGEAFTIDDQSKPWIPEKVPEKNGNGTILVCKKYAANGTVIEQFALPHMKKGLWALSSDSAKYGVFHKYIEPKSKLEKFLNSIGSSSKVIEVTDSITDSDLDNSFFDIITDNSTYVIYLRDAKTFRGKDVKKVFGIFKTNEANDSFILTELKKALGR